MGLAAVSLACPVHAAEPITAVGARANGPMRVDWDADHGRVQVYQADGRLLLANANAAVAFPDAMLPADDARFVRESREVASPEPMLPGTCLEITGKDREGRLDLLWRVTALSDRPGVVFELLVTNTSDERIQVRHSEPLRLLADEGGGCGFGSQGTGSRVRKALTHGRIYYDPGQLVDFTPDGPGELYSHFNVAFFAPHQPETLVVGYLENRQAEGLLSAGWIPSGADPQERGRFNLVAQSQYNDYFVIEPGRTVSSGRLLVLYGGNPFDTLETYTRLSGRLHQVRLNPPINGWCSWFVTYGGVSEEEILKHAEFVARHLKPYGMDWIQIDDGYQTAFGNWEGNARFPHGMKWLADRIKDLGLRPGIWVAPFAISADTAIATEHPDWLVHDLDGRPQPIVPHHQPQAQYILDVTHPQARRWLADLFRTLTQEWGYDFVKTDFVEWTILAARRYHDPAMSKAAAYRLGCQVMRDAMGPDRHLLDCGPGPIALGLIDSMRIELDRPTPPCTPWEHYWGWYNSAIPATAKRYYFHQHAWYNDPDHLRLEQLTLPQARAAATIIGLAGGPVISGDRLYTLDPARLDILKQVLPSYGQTARPLDLFEQPLAETFALRVSRPFGKWWLVGCFHGGPDPVARELDLARVGLDPERTYLVYEFWSQELIAEAKGQLTLRLEPTSVQLLVIREKLDVPQVLATDRHVTAGGIELADVRWNAEANTLSGVAIGKPGMAWSLAVHVPAGYSWAEGSRSHTGFHSVHRDGEVLRGQVRFDTADRLEWSLRFMR